jgi:hypothetical protein
MEKGEWDGLDGERYAPQCFRDEWVGHSSRRSGCSTSDQSRISVSKCHKAHNDMSWCFFTFRRPLPLGNTNTSYKAAC